MIGQPYSGKTLTDDALGTVTAINDPIAPFAGLGDFVRVGTTNGWAYAFQRWCWQYGAIDALVLSAPSHHGTTPELAREVYHRLLIRFASDNVLKRQRWMLLLVALGGGLLLPVIAWVAIRFGQPQGESTETGFGGFPSIAVEMASIMAGGGGDHIFLIGLLLGGIASILFGTFVFMVTPQVMRGVITNEIRREAAAVVMRCFLRGIPVGTPADLADVWRHGWITSESAPITSELTDTDASSVAALQSVDIFRGTVTVAFLFLPTIGLMLGGAFLGYVVAVPIVYWGVKMLRTLMTSDLAQRRNEIEMQRAVEGSLFIAAGGQAWAKLQERARIEQIANARKDTLPLVTLGTTTGILAARGDLFAPSEAMPFQLSLQDLQNHVIVFGGTGSGKTSGILRPLAQQVSRWRTVGIVVMDGKGSLPRELERLEGMNVIDPATTTLSLVKGLSPNEVVDAIAELLGSKESKDPFWNDSAAGLLRRAAVMCHAAGGRHWTLSNISRAILQAEYRRELLQAVSKEAVLSSSELMEAINFFEYEWKSPGASEKDFQPDRTQTSILTIAKTWMSTVMGHPDLLRWGQTTDEEESVNLYAPLEGGRIGFLIPAYRYGRAGAVVTALLKARLYAKLKGRADRTLTESERRVVFLIDEAQEVATEEDATMLAIGRSLGLAMIAATQTVEGVEEKLGEKTAAKWLAIFGGLVALPGRSPRTDGFAAGRVGLTWSATVQHRPGATLRETMQREVLTGITAANRYQALMAGGNVPRQTRGVNAVMKLLEKDAVSEPTALIGPQAGVNAGEILTLLARPDTALIVGTRARVPRRDVVQLNPVYEVEAAS